MMNSDFLYSIRIIKFLSQHFSIFCFSVSLDVMRNGLITNDLYLEAHISNEFGIPQSSLSFHSSNISVKYVNMFNCSTSSFHSSNSDAWRNMILYSKMMFNRSLLSRVELYRRLLI